MDMPRRSLFVLAFALGAAFPRSVEAQTPPAAPSSSTPSSPPEGKEFDPAHLEQLVAPIALYPDGLLTQILMASTYPLEVVEAARWVKANPGLAGDKLEAALKDETWDPSVKSLCGFPDVLARMNDNLDWTQDLGDAFIGQQAAVMDAVQTMRRKAYEAGNLKTTKEQTVSERDDKIIVIEQADPQVVYVPTYYPTAVYGGWSYPTYYYPPLYAPPPAGGVFFGFAAGVFWGAAIWGDCHWGWGHTEIDIDVDRQNTFIDRTEVDARRNEVKDRAQSSERWQHDPEHRKGVSYRDSGTAQRFGASQGETRVSRDQARGFADRGGERATTFGDRGAPSPEARIGGPASGRAAERPSPERPALPSNPRANGLDSSSFSGSRDAGFERASSARGAASRGTSGARRSGGGRARGGRGRG